VGDRISSRILTRYDVHGSSFTLATIEKEMLANLKDIAEFMRSSDHWETRSSCVEHTK
jgi:hypothetical protein